MQGWISARQHCNARMFPYEVQGVLLWLWGLVRSTFVPFAVAVVLVLFGVSVPANKEGLLPNRAGPQGRAVGQGNREGQQGREGKGRERKGRQGMGEGEWTNPRNEGRKEGIKSHTRGNRTAWKPSASVDSDVDSLVAEEALFFFTLAANRTSVYEKHMTLIGPARCSVRPNKESSLLSSKS